MLVSQFTDYLLLEKNCSSHTVTAYEKDVRDFVGFLEHELEAQDLREIKYPQIRNWIVFLVDQGLSNRTINRKIASLKAFYRFLQKTKQIEVSPLAKHRALKASKKLQVPFSVAEVDSVLKGLGEAGFSELRNKLIVELFYTTGIRRNELIEIKLHDVDINSGLLKVHGKRNKERFVPLLPVVQKTLTAYIDVRLTPDNREFEDYLLLTDKAVKLYESFVYRVINNYFSKASIRTKKSPHILRHSFATHLLNEGADINAVKELLGHSSLAATQVYIHNSISELNMVHKKAHPRNK